MTITNATRWIDSLIAEAKDGLALVRDRLCMVIATIVIGRSLRRNWRFWFRYWNAEQTLALKGISSESAKLFSGTPDVVSTAQGFSEFKQNREDLTPERAVQSVLFRHLDIE